MQKVGKSAILAMAECIVQERTNTDLLAYAARKEAKKKRRKGNTDVAMVMNKEVLAERQQYNSWQFK